MPRKKQARAALVLRMLPEVHKALGDGAHQHDTSMNELATRYIRQGLDRDGIAITPPGPPPGMDPIPGTDQTEADR